MTQVCCVCGKGKVEVLHVHHVIPQAYGGRDGKVVDICAEHHNMVHSTAVKMIAAIRKGKGVDFVWPANHGKFEVAKYLVGEIVKAALNSKTKVYVYQLKVGQHERDMLQLLKEAHGVSSLEKTIYASLNDSFNQRFQ